MIKVMIVGQKWLTAQLLKRCVAMSSVEVILVSVPCIDDRTAVLAKQIGVPVTIHSKALDASAVPNNIDVILTAHAYCFVNANARAKAKYGAVGYHPSLLPAYRGKTAIEDAFSAGEEIIGGTLYQLDDGWDTGQVITQVGVPIDANDTVRIIWQDKLAPLGLELFERYLKEMK